MTDDNFGRCPHCEAYIGIALSQHVRHCELRPDAKPKQHDPELAERGECQCPTCYAERMVLG